MYTATVQVSGAAQRVRGSTSPPSSAMTGREGGGEGSGAEGREGEHIDLHPLSEGGTPTFIKLVTIFNVHVKVPLTLMYIQYIRAPD